MMRLNEPGYSCEQAVDECIAGITGNVTLRQKLASGKSELVGAETEYLVAAGTGELHTITPINGNADPIVIGSLRKSDLIKVYEQYFVPDSKPARRIYDALLNAAREKCPFCGGIGTPHTLDHFLPKAHFPQFSILPRNIVPACRDCNLGDKTESYAADAEDQVILTVPLS